MTLRENLGATSEDGRVALLRCNSVEGLVCNRRDMGMTIREVVPDVGERLPAK
jgi:hypothetical protein